MIAANSQTVRQIESTLHAHAHEILDEIVAAAIEHPLALIVDHAMMQVRSNDGHRVLSRSSGTVDRLVGDVSRATYLLFLDAVHERQPEVDADGKVVETDRGRIERHVRLRLTSI